MNKLKKCDKCHAWINGNNKCFCGTWIDDYREVPYLLILEKALLFYDHHCEQNNTSRPLSGDHYSGNCYVFFKGDYQLCDQVTEFIIENSKDQNFDEK